MRALSDADCLDLWERGWRLHPLDRGLLAIGTVLPDLAYDTLADWPLGRRNDALAELHGASFGRNFEGRILCPVCKERLEFRVDGLALQEKRTETATSIVANGCSFRLPTTRDLVRVARESDPGRAVLELVRGCQMDACSASYQEQDFEEIGDKMASADPLGEIRLKFDCVKCGHQWQENLDLVAFLWAEIEARAKRLLVEVHTLAAAYGWTEGETLSLSDRRRRFYLKMVRA